MSLRANSFVISRIGSQNAFNTDGAKRGRGSFAGVLESHHGQLTRDARPANMPTDAGLKLPLVTLLPVNAVP